MDGDGGGGGCWGQRALRAQMDRSVSRWRSAFARPFIGAATGRESDGGGAGRGDREAAAAADDSGRDRRDAGDAVVDGVGDSDSARAGAARPARARTAAPVRALAPGPG